jgi:hypothetical protein
MRRRAMPRWCCDGKSRGVAPDGGSGQDGRTSHEDNDPMALEDIEAELSLLVTQMENQPEDRRELYLLLREKLNELRAFGMPVPDDLLRMEQDLEAEFAAER